MLHFAAKATRDQAASASSWLRPRRVLTAWYGGEADLAGWSSQPQGVQTTSVNCGSQYLRTVVTLLQYEIKLPHFCSTRSNCHTFAVRDIATSPCTHRIFCSAACDGNLCPKLKSSIMDCSTASKLPWPLRPASALSCARARYLAGVSRS